MATVELTTEQVLELVRQLPAQQKRDVLLALARDSRSSGEERMAAAEQQLRRLAAERGLDWNSMSDEERQLLVDNLIHEDRSCRT
jgi:hypothetical protein